MTGYWPCREEALALVEAVRRQDYAVLSTSANLAQTCFTIYGYPELEASAFCRALTEASMKPRAPASLALNSDKVHQAPDLSTGLGPRRP